MCKSYWIATVESDTSHFGRMRMASTREGNMQRAMERHWQTGKRQGSRKISGQRKKQIEFKDFLELSAQHDRRMLEIGRLVRRAGSGKARFKHRMEELSRQQLECSNRIREMIRCMMGWCY